MELGKGIGIQENLFSYIWKYLTSSKIRPPTRWKGCFPGERSSNGGFEERDCSRYPIITRAWRVYRSINRLCCVARILSRSDDVINDYLSASYRALMTSSGAPRQRDTMKTSSKIQQSSRVFFLWKQYSFNVFKNREERERKKAGIIR